MTPTANPPSTAPPERAAASRANTTPATPSPAEDRHAAENTIRSLLEQYSAAFNRLDAAGVAEIWPQVNQRALERAFGGLDYQEISLGDCSLAITPIRATANCTGTAAWTQRVGGESRTAARRWRFEFANRSGTWQIVRVDVK